MRKRDLTIDILRGIAVFTMIAANMAPYALAEPHPFWFRLIGTFAAPIFITLSGMMAQYAISKKSFQYFILRGLQLIIITALIDILNWKIIPFTTVDVLYLIGMSMPVLYILRFFNLRARLLSILLIFSFTPLLQKLFGYSDYPTEYYLNGTLTTIVNNQTSILNHWLIDGWFPLFPWLGFSIFGSFLAEIRKISGDFSKQKCLYLSLTLIFSGIILAYFQPHPFLTRAGYSELFYPPSIDYILGATGLIVMLFYLIDNSEKGFKIYQPFKLLGEFSLLIYILHLVIISKLVEPFWFKGNVQTFLIPYSALLISILGITFLLRKWKEKPRKMPVLLKILVGS